jgi:hypothetical protein
VRIFSRADLPSLAFKHWWPDDSERGVVIQKATFGFDLSGNCDYLPEQPGLLLSDDFYGDPATSSLHAESDLAPFKPRTDLLIRATARAPGGVPAPDWPVSVAIPDRLFYQFQVCGPRFWQREGKYWRLTKPVPIVELPIRYESAFGGIAPGPDGVPQTFQYNPAGCGFAIDDGGKGIIERPAPQIGLLADFAQGTPLAPMTVCGLTPLAKTWLPRRAMAGTFDDAWLRTRHPRMPANYDFGYWNAAPPPLQLAPYLVGNETIFLSGVHTNEAPLSITLPGLAGHFRLKRDGERPGPAKPMALDTVIIDVEPADRRAHTMTLVWRAHFASPADVEAVETSLDEILPGDPEE